MMMKNISLIFAAVLLFGATQSFAGVTFLPATDGAVGSGSSSGYTSSEQRCRSQGYTRTSCGAGQILVGECPYDSSYFQSCCPEEYRFTKEECLEAGLHYSESNCAGFYKCL